MCVRGSFHLIYLATCGIAAVLITTLGCKKAEEPGRGVVRLVDAYTPELLANPTTPSTQQIDQTVWSFDAAAPTGTDAIKPEPTWTIDQDVADLTVSGGAMVGRTTGPLALIHTKLDVRDRPRDVVHSVEIRMRSSVAGNFGVMFSTDDDFDLDKAVSRIKTFPEFSLMQSPVVAGDGMSTYTLVADLPIDSQSLRHIAVVPIDQPDAEFAIESLRVVFRREHLAAIPSGISWQGLSDVFRETLVTRAAEAVDYVLHMPSRPWLDVALGTLGNEPVTFFVDVDGDRILQRTVTRANHWESLRVDLARYAGRQVKLRLSAKAEQPDILALWGAPAIRSAVSAGSTSTTPAERPQGVILIWADTLRRDHLDLYGYERETGPNIRKLAEQGANFTDCVLQATWTKVSTPSLMTGMYARSHRVWEISHKLPAVATTIAEVFRDAGYATLSLCSIVFTGKFTNLHQGFEVLHESSSLPEELHSKTAREYVDRLLLWLDDHRDVPFFVFLHIADPHDPYEPYPPYNTIWGNAAQEADHAKYVERVKEEIKDPLRKQFAMPTRDELVAAGIDPEEYVAHDRNYYDGSIRAMDAEIGRLMERLAELDLDDRTLVVFTSDHGEEFLEHGWTFHGQSVYGELSLGPLVFWGPPWIPAARRVEETVTTIDIMPTILDLFDLPIPDMVQGQSLLPHIRGKRDLSTPPTLAITEKHRIRQTGGPPPRDVEAFAVHWQRWKLVQIQRGTDEPVVELYDHAEDLLDRHDVAAEHPEVVARLSNMLKDWLTMADAERLPEDASAQQYDAAELERLRSLGYIE